MNIKRMAPLSIVLLLAACGSNTAETSQPAQSKKETDEIIEGVTYDDSDLEAVTLSESKPYEIKGDYVYFGEYPQTIKKADVTINESETKTITAGDELSFNCYKGSDGSWYAKVKSNTYSKKGYYFSDMTECADNTDYFFRVLPLKWRILSKDFNGDGTQDDYLIFSERTIQPYYFTKEEHYSSETKMMTKAGVPENTPANNYEHSDIREYLNDEFYNGVFAAYQRELIKKVTVKNDRSQTGASATDTVVTCNDTEDYIFLPSYAEVTNEEYGFDKKASYGDFERQKYNTDFSRATGTDHWGPYGREPDYFTGKSIYWLRTAYPNSNEMAARCSRHGYAYFYDNAYKYNGGIAAELVLKVK